MKHTHIWIVILLLALVVGATWPHALGGATSGLPALDTPTPPLGTALLGRTVGDTIQVQAPRGAWQATIVEIRQS